SLRASAVRTVTVASVERPASYQSSFFFQAEDGIRDFHVTGVQTCALPICPRFRSPPPLPARTTPAVPDRRRTDMSMDRPAGRARSEERRVGKECRSRGWPEHEKKKGGQERGGGRCGGIGQRIDVRDGSTHR